MIDQLSTLEPERKAFRLIGGILVEKTVGEALPAVQQNYEGVSIPLYLGNRMNNSELNIIRVNCLSTAEGVVG